MKNILIALDFEEKSINLLNQAIELAKHFEIKVWVVHVVEQEIDYVATPDAYNFAAQYLNLREAREKKLEEEHKMIQKYVDILLENGIQAEGHLIEGPIIKSILSEINKLNIDLIIIGSHKHGFLYNAVIKDPSVSLVEKSNTPLLVVPL